MGTIAAIGLCGVLAVTGCAAMEANAPQAESVPLRIRGTPPEATVIIDDQRDGPLSLVMARGIRVLPGRHRLSVEAAGFLPYDVAFEAKDEVVPIEVKLVPVPD
jgi:hypothetical protein